MYSMYSIHVPFPLIHPVYVRAGLACLYSDTDTTAPTLTEPNMTTGAAFSCPDGSSSQCWSSTSVSMMCLQNTVTFSALCSCAQTDISVALQPSYVRSFSSPLFPPSLLKESHLFRCLLLSLSLPQQTTLFLASVLPLSIVWISCVQSSLGPAGQCSEGQEVSQMIIRMIKI